MPETTPSLYHIRFAGESVAVLYDDEDGLKFLDFLFADLHASGGTTDTGATILRISEDAVSRGEYALAETDDTIFCGVLGVQFAAVLFDRVIYHLLHHRQDGVALHTGAVAYQGKTVLLPGKSGSGKSSVTARLTVDCCSYLTDELIFLPENGAADKVIPFPRPLCIKAGSLEAIRHLLPENKEQEILMDRYGAVVPHRLLNPDFSLLTSPPSLILFPTYQPEAALHLEEISPARASSRLMSCDVNARNLPDHGFSRIVRLARSTPAYQLTYSSFSGFSDLLPDLFSRIPDRSL